MLSGPGVEEINRWSTVVVDHLGTEWVMTVNLAALRNDAHADRRSSLPWHIRRLKEDE